MKPIALIVRHKTKPGMRNQMRTTWESYVKPNALINPNHLAYYFCYDTNDENGITAFQVFSNIEAKDQFLKSAWYPEYLKIVSEFISEPPLITSAEIIWNKNEN